MPGRADLVLEIAGHVTRAMIVTQPEPTRHAGRDGAEAPMGLLPDRLQRLEAISSNGLRERAGDF